MAAIGPMTDSEIDELFGRPWDQLPEEPPDTGPTPEEWLRRHLMETEGMTAAEADAEAGRRREALKRGTKRKRGEPRPEPKRVYEC